MKSFTRPALVLLTMWMSQALHAQSVITQWNFNSATPDNDLSTGTTNPSTGAGTLTVIGGLTPNFASANASGGSSDPITADNSGLGLTSFPTQGTANKTAGIQFAAATTGYQDIRITFDLRHSNTGPANLQLQYTTNITATTPAWTDFQGAAATGGDAWFPRNFDLSTVPALNNNPNAGFRIVSAFASGTSYAASNSGSNYAPAGTWRFDMVSVKGTSTAGDNTPPVANSAAAINSTTSYIKFNEPLSAASAGTLSHYTFTPSLTISTATLSPTGDTVWLSHAALSDGQPYTLDVNGVQDLAGNTMSAASFNLLFNAALPPLVITEIIHSPNDIEMIEIYNPGPTAIPLGGLKWTDGTTGAFPVMTLQPDSAIIFATAPTTASASLHVNTVYTINNGLGSTDDILVIRNGLNQVIDSVAYYVGINGWPSAPTGTYGYSFELNNATNDNNLGSNWAVPLNTVSPQPAGGVVRATPGKYPAPAIAPTATVSFVGTKTNVSENSTEVAIVANLTGGGASPASIDLELLPIGTATSGSDFTLPADMQFNWPANANNVNDTIRITINNDVLAEPSEYFILRLSNPVNTIAPGAAANNFTVFIQDDDFTAPAPSNNLVLNHLNSFSNGPAGPNSAEIVVHDPASQRLFIANSLGAKLDIVDFDNPAAPVLLQSVSITPYGNINSVVVKNGIVAAAVESADPQTAGKVVFFDTNGVFINQVTVGAMPDMIVFNHAGTRVLTANEGEPNTAYTSDPEGSVSIIDISGGIPGLTQANVSTAAFTAYNSQVATLKASGVRIFGPGATVAQDIEPEYITISADDQTAWVTCQENNALATLDLQTATITALRPLGTKDHMQTRNALDASDQGGVVQIANWPVKGLYMPDAITSFSTGGQTYLLTANEGDSREYNGYSEIKRLSDASYVLDPVAFPYPEAIKANIGRLNITTASGDTDNDGDFDEIHAYGGRSFSIWNATTGALVWDSGDDMEQIIAHHPVFGPLFNASNANNTFKNRSDDKGPEPEGITVATINNKVYAFVALERIGGCMVYDITNPAAPVFSDYKNTRTIASYGGDQGAEGIMYIKPEDSPNGSGILILANEVSSTLAIFQVQDNTPLAIKLTGIQATNVNSRNRIDWNSASEDIGDRYELEKSTDGQHFNTLAGITAKGNAAAYTYWDEQPATGWTYYRLKLSNTGNDYSYSQIVKAYQEKDNAFRLNAYPNPASDALVVSVNQFDHEATVTLRDVSGKIVLQEQMTAPSVRLDMKRMPAGIYMLHYKDGAHAVHMKLSKQ